MLSLFESGFIRGLFTPKKIIGGLAVGGIMGAGMSLFGNAVAKTDYEQMADALEKNIADQHYSAPPQPTTQGPSFGTMAKYGAPALAAGVGLGAAGYLMNRSKNNQQR